MAKKTKKEIPELKKPAKRYEHAEWDARFWAWLIDVIIVWALVGIFISPWYDTALVFGGLATPLIMFFYWGLLEHYRMQSIGKMALDIKVSNLKGKEITLVQSFVQSFGKAFLLPLDCLIGWIAMEGQKVRLFNKISDTIVIKK